MAKTESYALRAWHFATYGPVFIALACMAILIVVLAWMNKPLVDKFMVAMVPKW